MEKEQLRTMYIDMYKKKDIRAYTVHAFELLTHAPDFLRAAHVLAFAPLNRFEIPYIASIMQAFPNKQYYFPRISVVDGSMTFHHVTALSELSTGTFGIQEPEVSAVAWDEDMSTACMFVPALALSREGVRLGHGKGYYDKFLSSRSALSTLCVVPDFAFAEKLPRESHDIPVRHSFSAYM